MGFLLLSAILSPIVGVVAVFISMRSLAVTEKNMELGQRAYLTVTNTSVSTGAKDPLKSSVPGLKPQDHVIQIGYSFLLHNVGNTPARIEEISTNLTCPTATGWKCYGVYHNNPALIGPRSDVRVDAGADAVLTDAAFQEYSHGAGDHAIEGKSQMDYLDQFSQKDSVEWCWRAFPPSGDVFSFPCAK
jgi:hypothetical protein